MKHLFLTLLALTLFLNVNAQRSLEFEVFTNKFFYEKQTININKKINSNNIKQFYLRGDDAWLFLHSNGSIQRSTENDFVDIDNSLYEGNSSYSKQAVKFYFPINNEECYLSTGKELIHIKPDKSAEFLSSEKDFRSMQNPKVNILQMTAASKNNNGEVFLAGLGISRKETGIKGVTAGLEYLPNGIFKISNGKVERFNPVPEKRINMLACGNNGVTWAATKDAILKYENGAWKVYNSGNTNFPEGSILDLFVDSKNRLWVATDKTAGEFTRNTFKEIDLLKEDKGYSYQAIHVDDNDVIWIGTRKHGVLMIWNDFIDLYHSVNSPVSSNSIRGIYTSGDNKKIFITGTRAMNSQEAVVESGGNGIATLKIDNRYFSKEYKVLSPFNTKTPLNYGMVKSNKGTVYAINAGKLYHNAENEASEIKIYERSKLTNFIHEVDFDTKGNIWAATNHYLKKYDGNVSETFEVDKKTAKKYTTNVGVDKNDNVWIATKAGLSKFDGASWTNYNKKNSELPDNNIKVVFCDSKNNLWVGSKNWLAIIKDGQFTVYDKKTSEIGKAGVYYIHEASNGDIWIKAGRSLAKYTNGKFEFVEEFKNKYPNDFFIHNDYLIARASGGIVRYNLKTKEFKTFDDFLVSKEVSHLWKVNDEIWIQSYERKEQKLMSPTEKAVYEEQRKKIPEEHLRITDNDEDYHFEYMLIKYPLDKLLTRE